METIKVQSDGLCYPQDLLVSHKPVEHGALPYITLLLHVYTRGII